MLSQREERDVPILGHVDGANHVPLEPCRNLGGSNRTHDLISRAVECHVDMTVWWYKVWSELGVDCAVPCVLGCGMVRGGMARDCVVIVVWRGVV